MMFESAKDWLNMAVGGLTGSTTGPKPWCLVEIVRENIPSRTSISLEASSSLCRTISKVSSLTLCITYIVTFVIG